MIQIMRLRRVLETILFIPTDFILTTLLLQELSH
jgi:hypothetical protein